MAYTQWLPRSNRQGGEWNSPNVVIPSGITTINILLDLVQANDFSSPTQSITLTVEVSKDSGTSWELQMRVGWIGGTPNPRDGLWTASVTGINLLAGFLARAHISQSGAIRYGIRGEII